LFSLNRILAVAPRHIFSEKSVASTDERPSNMALWNFKSKDRYEDVESVSISSQRSENVPVSVVVPSVRRPTSVIAAGAVISGSLSSPGDIQIEGHVIGDVRCATLTVGKDGDIKGNVTAETATIRGRVTGNVRARTIQLAATGAVDGDLSHAVLIIEEGGVFQGHSQRAADPLSELALSAPVAVDAIEDTIETNAGSDDDELVASANEAEVDVIPSQDKEVEADAKTEEPGKNLSNPPRSSLADALGDKFAVAD
jgi:cytoskeletal protein CcmA (bactofilin family)